MREPRQLARAADELRHQLGDGEREDRVHVIPELPLAEHLFHRAALADAAHEAVEEGIEVVVEHDKRAGVGVSLVVPLELADHLQLQRGLPGSLLTKHDRRARIGGVAIDLVPRRVKRRLQAGSLEDGVVLRVFLGERVACDPVMLKELVDLHRATYLRRSACWVTSPAPYPRSSSETRRRASRPSQRDRRT